MSKRKKVSTSRYYVKEQWRAATYEGEIVFRDTAHAAAEDCAGEPDRVWGVFWGTGTGDELLMADCYTEADAKLVQEALTYYTRPT
jgi:hypothetical protein